MGTCHPLQTAPTAGGLPTAHPLWTPGTEVPNQPPSTWGFVPQSLAGHPTSPAHTQLSGWPWLAALRQDMTVCRPGGRLVTLPLQFGEAVSSWLCPEVTQALPAEGRLTATPPASPAPLTALGGPPGSLQVCVLSPAHLMLPRALTSPTSRCSQGPPQGNLLP